MATSKNVNRTVKLYIDNQEIDGSVKSIKSRIRELTGEMNKLTVGTKEYEERAKKIRELNGILAEHRRNIKGVADEANTLSSRFGKIADGFNRYMGVIGGAIASLTGLTMTIRKTVQDFADMEEEMAQVRKYTGMTDEEVKELNEDLKALDTRTSREELNKLAGEAGRLGITSKEAILEFVDGADKIRVALGDDLGETAVRDIGKLAQMFGEDKKRGLRGAMLATGSAINELAQNSSAGADAIVQFTARLAGVAQQAGLTQAEIMGIGSVMSQNMQEIPTSATVVSQLITKMMQDTGRFAKLAGQDVAEFSNLLRTDANKALVTFLQAMKQRGGFQDMAKMFDEMKMDGTRAVGVLSALAGHLDQLAEAQSLANKAYAEGTSVINEFNVQNNTVQAQLDKAKKRFHDLSIELGEKLMPIARYGITTTSTMVRLLMTLIDFVGRWRTTLIAVTLAIAAYNVQAALAMVRTKLWIPLVANLKTAFAELWAVMKKNPMAAVATAAVLLIAALNDVIRAFNSGSQAAKAFKSANEEAADAVATESARLETLIATIRNANASEEERKKALEELNGKIMAAHLGNLTEEQVRTGNLTRLLSAYNAQLERSIKLRVLDKEMEELVTNYRKGVKQIEKGDLLTQFQRAIGVDTSDVDKMLLSGLKTAFEKEKAALIKEINAVQNSPQMVIANPEPWRDNGYTIFEDDITTPGAVGGGTASGGGKSGRTGRTGKVNDPAAEEAKKQREQLQKDLAAIDDKYQVLRNEAAQNYLDGEIETREEYYERLRELEMEELEERLGVLNLEQEKRDEIKGQILEKQIELMEELRELQQEAEEEEDERDREAEDAFKEHMNNMRDIASEGMKTVANSIGQGLMSALKGEKEGIMGAMKDVLKTILLTMVNYLEKQLVVDEAIVLADSIAKYGPIIGPIRAAASTALMLAPYEIAKGVIQAFDTGGFTGSGAWNEPKGIVHANEFVANRYATRNPAVLPVLNLIDKAQRTGSVANLSSQDIAAVLPTSSNGITRRSSSTSAAATADNTAMLATLASLINATQRLSSRLDEPILAETYVTGKRGINEAQSLADKMRSNVSRN